MAGKVDPRLDNPYAVLFFQIMRGISELQLVINQNVPEEIKREHGIAIKPVDFIFDDQGPAGLKCLQWYAGLRDRVPEPHRTVIANTPQFKDDRELNPLQAADMLAWHIRREFNYPREDRSEIGELLVAGGLWHKELNRYELEHIVNVFNSGRIDPASF